MDRRSKSDPYRRLFETMLDGAVVVDSATSQILLANLAAARMFGFASPEEMVGQTPLDYVPADDRDQVARLMAEGFEREDRRPPTEIRIRTKQGRLLWVSASVSLIEYEGKKAALTTMRDVTSEKARDAALMDAEHQYEHLFDGMIDGAVVLDVSTFRIALANKAAADMFGFESARDMIGEDPLAYIPEEDRDEVARTIALNLEGKGKNPAEIRVITRDKQQIWVSATASKIEYEGRTATLTTLRDMTADKAKDAALKAAEESKLRLIDAAAESIFVVQDWKMLYVNPAGAAAAGLPQKDMIGLSFRDFVHPDRKEAMTARYEKLLAGQWFSDFTTVKGIDAKGETRWAEIREIPYTWQGRPAVMSLVHDITDRMRADEERKEREERLRAIIENAWDGITILDENYKPTFESPSLARISGYTPEEWMGRPVGQMNIHPDDLAPLLSKIETLKSQPGSVIRDVTIRYQHRDGSWRWIEAMGHNLLHDPKVKGLVVNFRDITDKVQADEALREREERSRAIVENAWDGVFIFDDNYHVLFESPSLARMTGYSREEWVRTTPSQWPIHPDDLASIATHLEDLRSQPGLAVRDVLIRYKHKDGSWRFVEATGQNLLQDPKVKGIVVNFRDVTDRLKMEEALRNSEERFRTLIEKASDVVIVLDATGKITYQSPSLERVTGFGHDEWVGRPLDQLLIHPDDLPSLATLLERVLTQPGATFEGVTVRYQHKDGSWHTLEATVTNMLHDPKVAGIVANFRDITDRKAAQQALTESEQKYRLLVENSTDLIFSLDTQGNFTYVSPAIERISGYRVDEVVGTSFVRFVVPEDMPALMASFERALAGATDPSEFRAIVKDGSIRYVRTTSRVIVLDGQVTGLTGIMSDMTERKLVEEALQASDERNRLLIDNAAEVVTVLQDGLIKFINRKCIDLAGYLPEELISKSFIELIHPDDRQVVAENYVKRLRGEAAPAAYSFRVVHKSGEIRWAAASVTLFTWEGKAAVLGLLTDISDRKKAEEALQEAKTYAENVIQTANVLFVALDKDGKVTQLNEAGEKITGYRQGEVLGKNWFELIVPRKRYPHVWEEFERVKAQGTIAGTLENPILTKSGEERIISWKNSTLVLNDTVLGTLSFGTDITERKLAEKTLQESEEKFRLLTEKTNDLIWMTDINLVTIYASPSAERLLGFRPEELLKLSPDSLMTPESFGRAQETLLKQLDLEREAGADTNRSVTLELEYCRKDGSTVWLENRISGIRDAEGRLIGLHGVARDISERRQAEQALRDSEAIYKRLFENTQTAMEVVSGETGLVVLANDATARMFGFASADDLIGVDSMDYLLPEDRDRVAGQMAQALIDKDWSQGTELSVGMKDGRRLWIHGLVTNTEYKGKPALLISLVDMTSRKEAELRLAESEQKYRLLTEKTNDMIWTTDMNLRVTYVSPSVERMLGFTPEEHLKRDLSHQITPESFARAQETLLAQLALEQDPNADPQRTVLLELEYYQKNGSTVWLENRISGVRDANGGLIGLHGLARDVTERRKVEQALRASEEKYRLVAESTNDEIWTSDINLNTTYVSPSVKRILGFTPEERMKQDIMSQMTPESFARAAEALAQHLALEKDPTADPNRVLRIELEYFRKDGSTIWLENQVSGIRDANGTLIGFHGVARDVTKRRKTEQSLRESEEKYRLLAEKTNDIIWMADMNLRATYYSPSVERILGFTAEERLNQETTRNLTPESLARAREALSHHLALEEDPGVDPNRVLRIELEYYRKDGSTVWLEEHVSGLRDANGKLTGFHGVARDTSERRKADQALKESEERYRLLAENASDVIWVTNADLKVTYASPSTTSLLGYSLEELSARSFDSLLTPDSMARVAGVYKDALALEKTTPGSMKNMTMQMEVRSKGGSTVWLEAAINVIRDKEGRFAGFQGACRDITERKRAQEAVKASEEWFRTLIEESTDAIAILDSSGNLLYESPSMERITGYRLEDWMGKPLGDWLIHQDDMGILATSLERVLGEPNATMENLTARFKHKDGTWHTLEATVRNLLHDPKVGGLVINYRDVTQRKQAEEALSQKTEELDGFFSVALDLLCIADTDGRFHLLNRAFETTLGHTREELMTGKFFDFIHPDDVKSTEEAVSRLASGQEVINFVNRYRCRDGSYRWLEWRSAPYGKMIYAAARDITEQRNIQEDLAISEVKYRSLFDHTLLGTEVIDAETGKVVLANRSIANMFGFKSPDDMIGTSPIDYVLPEDLEWVAQQMAQVFANPEKRDVVNIRARTADGRLIWVTGSGASFEHDGKWSMLLSLIDVTAAKEAEMKLHEEEKKNRLLIDNAAEGIAVIQDGLVKFVNPKCSEFTGRSAEETISMPFLELVHPDDRHTLAENYARRLAGGDAANNYQFRVVDKKGNTKWLQINVGQLDWEGKPATLAMLNDITDRVKALEALAASEAKYRALFEHTLLGMEVVDGETGETVLANRSLAHMFGFKSVADMIGTKPLEYILPEDLEWVANQIAELMTDPSWDKKAVIRSRTADGRLVWVTGMATPFEYEGKSAMLISMVDITAAKESELKLQESEEKNRLLIDNAAEAIAVIQDGATKFFNGRLAELTGLSPEELQKTSLLDLVHPEERESIALNYMMRVAGQEVPNNYQFRIIDKMGQIKWLQVNAVLFNWEGKPASLTMFSDVTERVKAEQAVRDSEERFRAMVERASDAIAVLDASGKVTYYSPSMERATGYGPGEWVDKSLSDLLIHPDDLPALASHLERILKEPGATVEGMTTRYKHRDGTWHVLEATVRNMLDDPKVNGLVANFRDITERVIAEQSLRKSEERFRGLVETSSDWVWEVDRSSRYAYVSPKVRDILGYEPEELLGHTPFEFMHQREGRRVSRIMRRFAAERLPFSLLENTCTHKDGRTVVLESSAVPILDADGNFLGYRGIDRDITERKKVEQELQRSLKRLERTMESTIEAITTTIETRDPYTTGHQMRVTDLACTIAKLMEIPPTTIEGIRVAGLLHDIGKIAIPTEILSKPGKLNEVEYEMIKTHAKVGYNILKKIEFPWPVAKAVLQHHERWNGSGYPHGLRGEDILVEARILAVADVMEAMSSHRPYRPSIGGDKALDEIVSNSGILYDPAVAKACIKAFTEAGFKFTSAQPGAPPSEAETTSSDRPAHLRENN